MISEEGVAEGTGAGTDGVTEKCNTMCGRPAPTTGDCLRIHESLKWFVFALSAVLLCGGFFACSWGIVKNRQLAAWGGAATLVTGLFVLSYLVGNPS